MRVCGLALDIDGTLTVARGTFELDLEVAGRLRRLARRMPVMLVTGNSLPVVAGLARYLDLPWPHVGENGCLVFHRGRIGHACWRSTREAAEEVAPVIRGLAEPSWQNRFRLYDFSFNLTEGARLDVTVRILREALDIRGYEWVAIGYSGYAIHLRPPESSKAKGLKLAMKLARIQDPSCVVAVGDSAVDAELRDAGVVLAAVENSDPELIRVADIILPGPSSRGVAALLDSIESGKPL